MTVRQRACALIALVLTFLVFGDASGNGGSNGTPNTGGGGGC